VASCATVLISGWLTGALWAQDAAAPGQAAPQEINAAPPLPPAGPQIASISVYGAYYSHGLPETGAAPQTNSANVRSDEALGGSIVLDWSKFTERTIFSLTYSPSYTAQVRYSSLDALNHVFSLTYRRKLTPRWTLGFSVAGNYSSLEESLFAPTALSNVAAVPATANGFAAALLAGNFTNNPQLGAVLTNSPLVESPLANLLYGQRMLTASGQSTLSYSFSPRLSVTFSGGGARTQPGSDNRTATTGAAPLIPNTTSETASAVLSYSLSTAAQLGGSVTTTRVSSFLEDAYSTTSLATFGRTLGKKWVMQLHGGVGVTNYVRQTLNTSATKPLPAAGGSLGLKTTSHTFLGSFDHTVSDPYGFGASTVSTSSVTWRWQRPGSAWSLESSVGWQQLQSQTLAGTSGWRWSALVNRAIRPNLALLWQYTYLKYSGGLQTAAYNLSESAVRVSFVWTSTRALR